MEKSKLEQYADIQALVQKEIDTQFPKLYQKYAPKYAVANVPLHKHNGFDSPQISEDDVIKTVKLNSVMLITESETFYLKNIANVTRISLQGFAVNDLSAPIVPTTQRVSFTGEAIFGKCFLFTGEGTIIDIQTQKAGTPFVQGCSGIFTDIASINNTRVFSTNGYLLLAKDSSNSIVAQLTLDAYENGYLKFTSVLETDWRIQASIIIE